jgi:hypothetical protein
VTLIDQNSILRIYYKKLFMYGHMCFTVNMFLPVSSKTCNTVKLKQILYMGHYQDTRTLLLLRN